MTIKSSFSLLSLKRGTLRSWCRALCVGIVACSSLACRGGGALKVLSQASPNPLDHNAQFVLMKTTRNGLIVAGESEANFVANKATDRERVAFRAALDNMERSFGIGLQSEMTRLGVGKLGRDPNVKGVFLVKVNTQQLEPGFNYYITGKSAFAQSAVSITDVSGAEVDKLVFNVETGAAITDRVADRFERIGETTGKRVARYLAKRMGLKAK